MEVETVHGTMDIHIGARFAEVYGHLLFPTLFIIWEVISDPKVEIRPDGSKFVSWMSRNTRTGRETIIGISYPDIHYSSHIYPIDHPKIKRLNTNKHIKIGLLTIALALFEQLAFAQEVVAADTIDAEEAFGKKHITQVPLEQCEQIDTCSIAKFAIVSKDGKQGIYDLEKHENVTEINLDVAGFSRRYVSEDGIEVFYFYVEKGVERGTIGVVGENNQTVGVWVDNPEYVAKLEECTTIDSVMTQKCQEVLSEGLKSLNGTYGQIAVIDAQTGRLKSWVALEKDRDDYSEGKLLKQACSHRILTLVGVTPMLADIDGSLKDKIDLCGGVYNIGDSISIRDHNWKSGGYGVMTCRQALTHKSNVAMFKILLVNRGDAAFGIWKNITGAEKHTSAMDLAAILNSVYQKNVLIFPTLEGDSVTEEPNDMTPLGRKYLQEVLIGLNKGDGIQASYAPKKVELAGIYGDYQGEEFESGKHTPAEMSFVGVFPAQKPRYALAVFINRPDEPTHSSKDFANIIVNKVVEWLSKH